MNDGKGSKTGKENTSTFRNIVGSLIYMVNNSRPEVENAAQNLTKLIECEIVCHYKNLLNILCTLSHDTKVNAIYPI